MRAKKIAFIATALSFMLCSTEEKRIKMFLK